MAQNHWLNTVFRDRTLSRRQMIFGSGAGIAGLSILCGAAQTGGAAPMKDSGAEDTATSIHQEIDLKANPQRVYEVLLDSNQFRAFTGLSAEISREAGGAFSCFENQIVGRNVELIPGRRIVQAWRSNGWPEGSYSIVKFELSQQGSGTRLVMDHRGFPDGKREQLEAGWKSHYWEPLAKYLANHS